MNNPLKKAQLTAGAMTAIILLIIGVGVSVLIMIFVGALGGQTYNLVESDINAIANNVIKGDTFLSSNISKVKLDHSFIQSSTLRIYNSSSKKEFQLTNFTIDYDGGTVKTKTAAKIKNGATLAANYTWGAEGVRTGVKDGILSGFTALKQTGNYLPIVVLAAIISLVLTLVLSFTAFGGGGTRGGAL